MDTELMAFATTNELFSFFFLIQKCLHLCQILTVEPLINIDKNCSSLFSSFFGRSVDRYGLQ